MALQYGVIQTRFTRDFDISIPVRDSILTELPKLEKVTWQGFSVDSIAIRDVYAPVGVQLDQAVQRIDIGLKYRNTKWLTVRLEITNLELIDTNQNPQLALHAQNLEIMSKLGFKLNAVPKVISPEFQVAQKLHAVTQANTERGRDLFDIWLLLQSSNFNFTLAIELLTELELIRSTHKIPDQLLITPQLVGSFLAATDGLIGPDISDAIKACNDLLLMKQALH